MATIRDINYSRIFSARIVACILLLSLIMSSAQAASVTFSPGAYIINMGSFPYTYNTGLKPYGLVYDLVINKQVPVSWAISPTKTKDGIDFTVPSGTGAGSYRGGSFIVPAEYAFDAQATLLYWKNTKLVSVVGPTTASFTAPIFENLTSFPNAVCDLQNGPLIIAAFYTPSEVPSSSYRLGSPSDLSDCDDIYAMPHADPQDWDLIEQTTFSNFINNGGDLWSGCHAVSALEADTPDYLGYYYLSQNGLIPWGDHDDATPPYIYNASSATHPVMQFIGRLDNSLSSGSEQVYIPDTTPANNNWRASTTVAVWDPYQSDVYPSRPGILAAKVAYGYAFGNSSKGFIVYEASHNFLTGNTSEDVDAARVYGNFLLYSGILHRPNLTAIVPTKMLSGTGYSVQASIVGVEGTPPFTYKWTSSCGGTFSNSSAPTTTFTAPSVTSITPCILRVTVTDACGRKNFVSQPVTIYPVMMTLRKTDYKDAVQPDEHLQYAIYYNNTGPITAENVIVTDLLPSQLIYNPTAHPAPLSVTPNINGTTTLVWNLGNVPATTSKLILLNATVKSTVTSGSIIDRVQSSANISGMGPVYRTAQDVDIVVPITKSVNRSTASAGDYLNYSMCVRYDEPYLLKNATVKDIIPDYTTYVAGSANANGTYYPGNKTIIWDLGSNEPGISSSTHPGTNIVNIPATYDMYVSNNGGNNVKNYGISTTLLMSQNRERAFLYFPMTVIPPSATINSATFNAFVTTTRAQTVSIRNLLKDWCLQSNQCVLPCTGLIAEGTYNGAVPSGTGAYGSTWNNYLYKIDYLSCPWTTTGGDYDKVTPFGTFSAGGGVGTRTVTGPQLLGLVQGWYAGTYANQGVLLESGANNDVFIGSRTNGGGATFWPRLQVTYYTTSPGSPTTVDIYATQDTYLSLNNPTRNYGGTTTLGLRTGGGNDMRTLLYFPLNLPSGATITSASLRVYVTASQTATITVRRLTRSWCLQSDQCYNLCQNKLVEGKLNGNKPDTPTEGYGTVWNFYYFNENSVACSWTGGSILNDIGAQYGTFSSSTGGAKSADITTLVQGWYTGSIPVRGVSLQLLGGGNDLAAIASREATDPTRRPYIRVNYTVGQGTNLSISARPLLSCQGGQIVVNVSANSSIFMPTITAPVLSIDAFNASVTLASGPSPASYTDVPALQNCYFTYVYNVVAGDYPGDIAFSGKPATPTYFATATSNRLLITPLLRYTVQINATTPESVNAINNTARFMDQNVFPLGAESNQVTTNLVWPRNIQVTKSANISQGVQSQNVLFTLVVKNTGVAALNPVEVVDTLPDGLEYVSSYNGSQNGQIITWANIGPLVKGESKTLTFVAHINGEVFGFLNNTVRVRGVTGNNNEVTNSSFYLVQAKKTDICGTKTPDVTEGPPSTTVNYTVTMTNCGEATLSPAIMEDVFPHGMQFVSSNPAPNSSDPTNHTYIWSWPSLAPGATKTVLMKVHLNGNYFGTLCNPVVMIGKTPSGLYVTNLTSGCVYVQEPRIAINKTSDFATGDKCNINYSINITNTGEVPLNSVTLRDYLPPGMQYISSNGSLAGSTVTWSEMTPLAPGESRIFYLLSKIKYSADGLQINEANVTGSSSTGLNYSAEDYDNFTVCSVGLDVNKTASPKEAGLLQNITFTINVTNTGHCTLDPITVIDFLPDGLSYGSDNQSGVVVGSTITWDHLGPLAAGEYANISLVTYVDGAAAGLVHNTVDATGKPEIGCDITVEDEESVTIYTKTDFMVTKTALNESVEPGDNVTFIINVTNTGDIALNTVKVVDVLPIGLVYVSDNSTPPGVVSGQLVTWNNVGPLAAGASRFIELIAKVVL